MPSLREKIQAPKAPPVISGKRFKFDDYVSNPDVQREVLDFYKRSGYAVIENVLESETLEKLGELMDRIWETERLSPTSVPIQTHERYPEVLELSRSERVVKCVEHLLESEAELIGSMMMFREPGSPGSNCHQDNYYLHTSPLGGQIGLWVAVDHANIENACLYVYAGSHRREILPVRRHWENLFQLLATILKSLVNKREGPGLQFYETIVPPGYQKAYKEVPAGTIIFLHGNLLHGSEDNRSRVFRRTLGFSYLASGASVKRGSMARRHPPKAPLAKSLFQK